MKISIITPSYNQASFIERTIQSVLSQGYKDLEYIIMDGGSTDGTVEILKKYSDKIIWKSEKDSGQSDAINKGLKMATGDIVAFLNSDDTYEPGALKKAAEFFQNNPGKKWVYGKCKIIDENDREIRKPITLYKNLLLRKYSYRKLLSENFISQPATFWKRELHAEVGYFSEQEHYCMDYEFWLRIGAKYLAGVIDEYLANFRIWAKSKTGQVNVKEYADALRVAKSYGKSYPLALFFHQLNYYKTISLYKFISIKKATILKTAAFAGVLVLTGFLTHPYNAYQRLFILAITALILVFIALRKKIGQNPELAFLAIALICGSLISIAEPKSPYYTSWDEHIHYRNADRISLKSIIEKNVYDVYLNIRFTPYSFSIKEQQQLDRQFDSNYASSDKKSKAKPSRFSIIKYAEIGYIPSSIALALGRLLHLPYHIVFMFGRWINVLLYALVVFFAIRKLKSGKMIMSVVALFPTAIFLASNYNYDSWVTAFTLLGLAYLFSELQQPDKKITTREAVIMLGALVIGLGPKAIYFPLLFLVFLLKPAKFSSLRQYKKIILASILSILFVVGSFMLPFLISGPGRGDHRWSRDVNPVEQVKFILSEPFIYAKILSNFAKDYLDPLNASDFMTFFAYLGMAKGFWLILATLGIVTFTDKNEYDKQTAQLKTRLLVMGVFLATVILICTALFISFTAVGSATIAGVQPRYLIPLLFPLLFVISSSRIKNPINKNIYNSVIFCMMSFVLLQGIWDLIIKLHY